MKQEGVVFVGGGKSSGIHATGTSDGRGIYITSNRMGTEPLLRPVENSRTAKDLSSDTWSWRAVYGSPQLIAATALLAVSLFVRFFWW